ncbi:hypothetical protein [Arthrobacter woluwensis]|uniref:hypothetical protein n=1 Tax=Arthrobacter woluwensis TaxID=156980 RepID=UPI001114FB4B|nr:hypothetical protein [Arthrobacter woluwensis]
MSASPGPDASRDPDTSPGPASPGPAGRRQLQAVRVLLRGTSEDGRWYPWYLAALLLGLVIGPGVWSVVLVLAGPVAPLSSAGVLGLVAGLEALLVLAAVATPAYLGPAWSSAEELHYLAAGPFGVRATLGARTRLIQGCAVLFALVLAALPVLAWWQGNGEAPGLPGILGTALGVGLIGGIASAVLASRKQRGPTGLTIPRLEDLTAARDVALAGLMTGDNRSLAAGIPRRGPRRTGRTFPVGLLVRSIAIDLRYLRQDPWGVGLALVLLVGGAVALARVGATPAMLAVVLLLAQAAMTRLSGALGDVADTVGFDVVVPQPLPARLLAHAALPLIVLLAAVAAPVLAVDPSRLAPALLVTACAALIRFASLGAAGLPAQYLTPVSTPVGDTTAVFMVLWLLRPVIPAVWLLWAGTRFPSGTVLGVLAAGLGLLAVLRFAGLASRR